MFFFFSYNITVPLLPFLLSDGYSSSTEAESFERYTSEFPHACFMPNAHMINHLDMKMVKTLRGKFTIWIVPTVLFMSVIFNPGPGDQQSLCTCCMYLTHSVQFIELSMSWWSKSGVLNKGDIYKVCRLVGNH